MTAERHSESAAPDDESLFVRLLLPCQLAKFDFGTRLEVHCQFFLQK
jgi:hypothetical protein